MTTMVDSPQDDPDRLCPGCKRTYGVTGGDFDPDWTVHPGRHWREFLDHEDIDLATAARRLGCSEWYLTDILAGQRVPSAQVCVAFATLVGAEPRFVWQLVANYQLDVALGKTEV